MWQLTEKTMDERSQEHGRGIHVSLHRCTHICTHGCCIYVGFHIRINVGQLVEKISRARCQERRREQVRYTCYTCMLYLHICIHICTHWWCIYIGFHSFNSRECCQEHRRDIHNRFHMCIHICTHECSIHTRFEIFLHICTRGRGE